MTKQKKILPPPHSNDYEKLDEYYSKHDTTDLLEADLLEEASEEECLEIAKIAKKSLKKAQVNLRLSPEDLDSLKQVAQLKDIPYGTLARSWIVERLQQEVKILQQN